MFSDLGKTTVISKGSKETFFIVSCQGLSDSDQPSLKADVTIFYTVIFLETTGDCIFLLTYEPSRYLNQDV